MHADDSLRRQRQQQVGDLDPIQNVRVDNCNGPKQQDSPIDAEIFGLTGQLRQGITGLGSLAISKREDIEQLRAPKSDIVTCQCVLEQCQFTIPKFPGPDLSCSCHALNIPSQPQ